jgi:hypothetical protein
LSEWLLEVVADEVRELFEFTVLCSEGFALLPERSLSASSLAYVGDVEQAPALSVVCSNRVDRDRLDHGPIWELDLHEWEGVRRKRRANKASAAAL